jgi:hypothetical protein
MPTQVHGAHATATEELLYIVVILNRGPDFVYARFVHITASPEERLQM